jgi:hypothetical protein
VVVPGRLSGRPPHRRPRRSGGLVAAPGVQHRSPGGHRRQSGVRVLRPGAVSPSPPAARHLRDRVGELGRPARQAADGAGVGRLSRADCGRAAACRQDRRDRRPAEPRRSAPPPGGHAPEGRSSRLILDVMAWHPEFVAVFAGVSGGPQPTQRSARHDRGRTDRARPERRLCPRNLRRRSRADAGARQPCRSELLAFGELSTFGVQAAT